MYEEPYSYFLGIQLEYRQSNKCTSTVAVQFQRPLECQSRFFHSIQPDETMTHTKTNLGCWVRKSEENKDSNL